MLFVKESIGDDCSQLNILSVLLQTILYTNLHQKQEKDFELNKQYTEEKVLNYYHNPPPSTIYNALWNRSQQSLTINKLGNKLWVMQPTCIKIGSNNAQ